MAIGLSLVLVGGGIDLSLPGTMALSAIAGGSWMQAGGRPGARLPPDAADRCR